MTGRRRAAMATAGALALLTATAYAAPAQLVFEDSVLVEAPVDAVWQVLTDYDSLPSRVPNMIRCRVLQDSGHVAVVEQVGRVSCIIFRRTVRVVLRVELDPFQWIRFHAVAGDFEAFDGHWRLQAAPDPRCTELHYRAVVSSRWNYAAILQRAALRCGLRARLEGIRDFMARRSGAVSGGS